VPNDPLEIRRVPVEIQDGAPNGYYYRALRRITPGDLLDQPARQCQLAQIWPAGPDLSRRRAGPSPAIVLCAAGGQSAAAAAQHGQFGLYRGLGALRRTVAYELGALPGLDEAGYLQSLLFRATRLVVDTGIHAKRWSREQATRYMMDTTGFVRGRSQSEIERYICMIGQACSYKIGHNVWVAQREKAQKALGGKFTMGWFHDVLKEGILPLAMLEKRVDERIAERLKA
jgi:uncharacterized protein (DUF885 family)